MSSAIVESPINEKNVLANDPSGKKLFAINANVIRSTGNKAIKKLGNMEGNFLVAGISSDEKREDVFVLIPWSNFPRKGPAIITVGTAMINP